MRTVNKIPHLLAFFTLFPISITVARAEPATQTEATAQFSREAYAALGAFRGMAEEHAALVLRTLRVIAESNEAKSAQWDSVKPLLMRFSRDLETAATAWFVRSDGSFYETETGGIAEETLKNGPILSRVISAREIFGELVISPSTGDRSIIIAVPVYSRDDKVVGGVGISLRAKLLSQLVWEHLKLPDDEYFYAVESNARLVLHQNAERMFKTPRDVGDEALGKELRSVVQKNNGVLEYLLDGKKTTAIFERSPELHWYFFLAKKG